MGARPCLALLPALALGAGPALATNGYFSHGYSVAQRSLGGAGTALASDALVVSINPANLVWVPERFDLNLGMFSCFRHYIAGERGDGAGPGVFAVEPANVHSANEYFVIPALAYSRAIDDRSSWGIALYGNGGMNTEYQTNTARFAQNLPGFEAQCAGTFGGGSPVAGSDDNAGFCGNGKATASVDLMQMFIVPSYARALGDSFSIGIAPIVAVQIFSATGLAAFARFSNDPEHVSDNGQDASYGYGARFGVSTRILPFTSVGASYQTRIRMSEFEEYAGLFAGQGDFDIPSNWNAGVAVTLAGRHTLLADYQHVNFSEVRAVGNPLDPNRFVNDCAMPRIAGDDSQSPACLGSASGPGFGWRDVSTAKFGYEFATGPLRLRAGYSRNRQPIARSEVLFNILAPAVPEEHFTAGISYQTGPNWFLDVSLMHARNNPVTGKNPLSNAEASEAELAAALLAGVGDTGAAFGPDPQDQDITLKMHQYEVMFGLGYRF